MLQHKDRLIISIENFTKEKAEEAVSATQSLVGIYRLGLPLLLREGLGIIDPIQTKVMIDLRVCDSRDTIDSVLPYLDGKVKFFTLNPFIGREALLRAVKIANPMTSIVVATPSTVLTDHDLKAIKCSDRRAYDSMMQIAKMAINYGAQGILCSPDEVEALREELGEAVTIICAGLQEIGGVVDNGNVSTPFSAMFNGADYLMIGKLITAHFQPDEMCKMFINRIGAGYDARKRMVE